MVEITLEQLAANQTGHLIAVVALVILAALAWARESSCPECQHCHRRKADRQRTERAFWKHAAGNHEDCDHTK